MLSHPRRAQRGGGVSPLGSEAQQQQLALPSSERQRVARALRVSAPQTVALLVLAPVRSLTSASSAGA